MTAMIAVFVVTQDGNSVHESALSGYASPPVISSPNVRMQISQQLQKYDMAIKRVDAGIARSKLALALHNKLVHDHQALLSEAARSRAMKQLRSQLAAKQNIVAAERQRLQVDALHLAQIEQHARTLLSPKFTPNQQELQAVAQEANIPPPPPLALMQTDKNE